MLAGAIAPEEAAFFAQGFGADIGALVQTQSTASGSSQSAQRRVYRAKGLLQQELEDRKSMLSEQVGVDAYPCLLHEAHNLYGLATRGHHCGVWTID
jgi:hypothetical protein